MDLMDAVDKAKAEGSILLLFSKPANRRFESRRHSTRVG